MMPSLISEHGVSKVKIKALSSLSTVRTKKSKMLAIGFSGPPTYERMKQGKRYNELKMHVQQTCNNSGMDPSFRGNEPISLTLNDNQLHLLRTIYLEVYHNSNLFGSDN
jgi:hypothetical protein